MTREEAKIHLEMQSDEVDEAIERYEEEIFRLIVFFLRDPVIPALARGRKNKINDLFDALKLFAENPFQLAEFDKSVLTDLKAIKGRNDFFTAYEKNKAVLRKDISSCFHAVSLCKLIDRLVKNEMQYAQILTNVTQGIKRAENVKLSEAAPVTEIMKECDILQNKGVIDSSLESFVNLNDNLSIFNLSKEVNRLRKILKNG